MDFPQLQVSDFPLPAFVSTLDGAVIDANPALLSLFGHASVPRTLRDLFSEGSQEDLPLEVAGP